MNRIIAAVMVMTIASLILTGCFWGDEFSTKHLTGPYYIIELQPQSGVWGLYFEDANSILGEPVTPPVVKVGFNETCIIMQAAGSPPSFYIVPLRATEDKSAAIEAIIGPLEKKEFYETLHSFSGKEFLRVNPNLTSDN